MERKYVRVQNLYLSVLMSLLYIYSGAKQRERESYYNIYLSKPKRINRIVKLLLFVTYSCDRFWILFRKMNAKKFG